MWTGLSVRLLRTSGSPRAFSPRDDKGGIFTMKGVKKMKSSNLSLRGVSEVRDVAIHRVSGDAVGVVCSVTEDQWIATGFALAMTRVVFSP